MTRNRMIDNYNYPKVAKDTYKHLWGSKISPLDLFLNVISIKTELVKQHCGCKGGYVLEYLRRD